MSYLADEESITAGDKMKVNILTYLSTGKFGEVGLGTQLDEALKLLGEPARRDEMDKPEKVNILSYNRFSANFGGKGSLYVMSLVFDNYSAPLSASIQLEGPQLTEKTTSEEMEKLLKDAGVKYEADVTDYSVTLKTVSKVEVQTVKDEASGKFLLQSIGINDFAYMWK